MNTYQVIDEKKLGEGHALYGFQGKRGACFLCDI